MNRDRRATWFVRAILPFLLVLLFLAIAPLGAAETNGAASDASSGSGRWWKGNMHTHTVWSDGNHYPEVVADWYKKQGYNFLVLTDHNTLQKGQHWRNVTQLKAGEEHFAEYLKLFGEPWVEQKTEDGKHMVRLKTFPEIQKRLEEPGRFILVPGEEISDRYQGDPVHVNAINVRHVIGPQGGKSMCDTISRDITAINAQRERTGVPMFAQLNHPNFGHTMTAEHIAATPVVKFFEVYNGLGSCRNYGDDQRAGTDRIWDIALSLRLGKAGGTILYATANDDFHDMKVLTPDNPGSGRAWVMVRADRLAAELLVAAIEAGDFYASTGVSLKDIRRDKMSLQVDVQPEDGISYTIQFLGTRKGFDPTSQPVTVNDKKGKPICGTGRYGSSVGAILAEVKGTSGAYRFTGDELYIRAKVISTKAKKKAQIKDEVELAWTQPICPAVR